MIFFFYFPFHLPPFPRLKKVNQQVTPPLPLFPSKKCQKSMQKRPKKKKEKKEKKKGDATVLKKFPAYFIRISFSLSLSFYFFFSSSHFFLLFLLLLFLFIVVVINFLSNKCFSILYSYNIYIMGSREADMI